MKGAGIAPRPLQAQFKKIMMMMISQIGTPRSHRPKPRNMMFSFQ